MSALATLSILAGYESQLANDSARIATIEDTEAAVEAAMETLILAGHASLLNSRNATNAAIISTGQAGLTDITALAGQYTAELLEHILTPYWNAHGISNVAAKTVVTTPLPVPDGSGGYTSGSVQVGNLVYTAAATFNSGVKKTVQLIGCSLPQGQGAIVFGPCNCVQSRPSYPGVPQTPEASYNMFITLRAGDPIRGSAAGFVVYYMPARPSA